MEGGAPRGRNGSGACRPPPLLAYLNIKMRPSGFIEANGVLP